MSGYEQRRERVLLPAPKFCGRGIEYVVLSRPEKAQARQRAAKLMGALKASESDDFATRQLYQEHIIFESVKAMIRGVTTKDGLKTMDDLVAAEWHALDLDQLETSAQWNYDALFGGSSLDDEAIQSIFVDSHGFNKEEIASIVGKALRVSAA